MIGDFTSDSNFQDDTELEPQDKVVTPGNVS
jgi:hypothetical protein